MAEFQGQTARGFGYSEFPSTHRDYSGPLQVQESSLASRRCLWVGVDDRAHLDEEQVRAVRDLLSTWLRDDEQEAADFGRAVIGILRDFEEWDDETLQSIGDLADRMKIDLTGEGDD